MLRDVVKEGGIYTIASFLTKGAGLLLIPLYTTWFTPRDYGVIDLIAVWSTLLITLVPLQLNEGLMRYASEPNSTEREKHTVASTVIYVVGLGYAVVVLCAVLFPRPFLGLLSGEAKGLSLSTFRLAVVGICLNGLFYLLGIYLRFLRKSAVFALSSLAHALLNLACVFYFVGVKGRGIEGVYSALIVATPVVIVVQLICLRGHLVRRFSVHHLKRLLRFSLPLVPAALADVVLNFTDRLFIKAYLSLSEVGIYGIGAKFASAVAVVVFGFSAALGPIIYQRHRDASTRRELQRIFNLFFALGSTGVLALSLFAHETLVLLTEEAYYGAATVMPMLYVAVWSTGWAVFSLGLHLREKTAVIPFVVIAAGLVNVVLHILLIRSFQLVGAAAATMTSMLINHLTLFHYSQRHYRIPLHLPSIALATLAFAFFWGVGSFVLPALSWKWFPLAALKAGGVLLYICIVSKMGLVQLKRRSA